MAWTERYVRADAAGGGDGTTDANSGANGAYTLAEANAITTPNGIRFNVKVGTYTCSSVATRSFGQTLGANDSCCFRGFNSTIGDLDDELDPANLPLLDAGSGAGASFVTAGARYFFRNLRFLSATGTSNVGAFQNQTNQNRFYNCYFEMTTAGRHGYTTTGVGDFGVLHRCMAVGAARGFNFGGNASQSLTDSFAKGGSDYGITIGSYVPIAHCIVDGEGTTTIGSIVASAFCDVAFCTVYDSDAVSKTTQGFKMSALGCLITNSSGYGLDGDNSATGDSSALRCFSNVVYNNTSGDIIRIVENQTWDTITASAQPMVDPTNGDYSLDPNGDAIQAASFTWLDLGITNYSDAGAVQYRAFTTSKPWYYYYCQQ